MEPPAIAMMLTFLYMFQQLEPKCIRYSKRFRKIREVHVVEDSSYLTRSLPIIFAMMAHLTTNPRCNWWKEPRQYTHYDVVEGDVWLHDPAFKGKNKKTKKKLIE